MNFVFRLQSVVIKIKFIRQSNVAYFEFLSCSDAGELVYHHGRSGLYSSCTNKSALERILLFHVLATNKA